MQRIQVRQARFASSESQLQTLLIQGLEGDAVAYHEFLKALSGHLRAYFRRRLFQRPEDVEDLVQETLLAVHNQRHTYRLDQPLTAWIHAIARYKFVDLLRARAIREDLNDPLDDDLSVFAESDTGAIEAKKDVNKLLADLPERQRLPIVHVKLEGLSVAETAQRTGMSESAIKVGIHRGLRVLAERMRGSK
ncbi:MAG: sigma-70 family RNA polymerase sigma factor [Burkholderiales bacterium]|nr:sigma-70 family RNA polymerase sigma factor [Burkholderiales bacterium]